MNHRTDPQATIYVAGAEKTKVVGILAAAFWSLREGSRLRNSDFTVEIHDNEDRTGHAEQQDDFHTWLLRVDVEPVDGVTLDHSAAKLAWSLHKLWYFGFSAIAVCDFAHLLPWNGGVQSPEMPPPWLEHTKRPLSLVWAQQSDLHFLDEFSAEFEGEPFSGYSVDPDHGEIEVLTLLRGTKAGAGYYVREESGTLPEFGAFVIGNIWIGGLYEWDEHGRLVEESINWQPGGVKVDRKWDTDGRLVSERRQSGPGIRGTGSAPWTGDHPPQNITGFHPTRRIDWNEAEQMFVVDGEPYWGFVATAEDGGRGRVRLVLDGREEGPVWEWDSSGELVLQGMLYPGVGKVGPWSEWGEQARLVRQTVFDALGNRIIERHFDEAGNIAHEERNTPTRLWRDPATGEERPAPWLWY